MMRISLFGLSIYLKIVSFLCSGCGVTFVGTSVQAPSSSDDKTPGSKLTRDVAIDIDLGEKGSVELPYLRVVLKRIASARVASLKLSGQDKPLTVSGNDTNSAELIVREFSKVAASFVVLSEIPFGDYVAEIFTDRASASPHSSTYLRVDEMTQSVRAETSDVERWSTYCTQLESLKARLYSPEKIKIGDLSKTPAAVVEADPKRSLHIVSVIGSQGKTRSSSCAFAAVNSGSAETGLSSVFDLVKVTVASPKVDLVLSSADSVTWDLNFLPGASLRSLTLTGNYVSSVSGVPSNISEVRAAFTQVELLRQKNSPQGVVFSDSPHIIPSYLENIGEPRSFGPPDASGKLTCIDKPFSQEGDFASKIQWLTQFAGVGKIASIQALRQAREFYVGEVFSLSLLVTKRRGLCYFNENNVLEVYE